MYQDGKMSCLFFKQQPFEVVNICFRFFYAYVIFWPQENYKSGLTNHLADMVAGH